MANISTNTLTKIEETQTKEFLSRAEIRTMRKDIQRLRESVALKERDRIVKLKTPEEEKLEKLKLERIEQKEVERQDLEKQNRARIEVLQKRSEEEKEAMTQLKDFANENERQQIFYLESEKVDLEKQLQTLQKEKEPPLLLQKNKFLLERKSIEENLIPFLEEEKKIENEQKFISETERTTNVPKDKQKLEKRRWELEEKREEMEKKRWAIEKEMEKIENQIKNTDDEYQKLLEEQKILKDKITEINNSLKSVYVEMMAREEEKRRMKKEQMDVEALKQAETESKRKEEIRRQEWSKKENIEEKPFLKGVPGGDRKERLVKKIQETSTKEEGERKKFLESIEEWAKEEDKNKNTKI